MQSKNENINMAQSATSPHRCFSSVRSLCILLVFLDLFNSTASQQTNANNSPNLQISKGSERFALEIFERLSQVLPPDYDFIISPFSIWSLLILTAEGSGGNTYAQLQNVLGIPNDLTNIREGYKHLQRAFTVNTSTIELALNQVMFTDVNRPIDNDFSDRLVTVYEADAVTVNFHDTDQAYNFINDYVISKTNGKLGKRVVHRDDLTDAQMMLISAIYFKGQWMMPFNISQTQLEPFYNEVGQQLGYVDMMYQSGTFGYTSIAAMESHVLELQYGRENRLSMIILLPKKGISLQSVLQRLQASGTQLIMTELERARADYSEDDVEVYLPRISTTTDLTLNQILQDMGLVDIFNANTADLSKISRHAFLSRLIHKAKIEINEEGTVASAATAGAFSNKNTPPRFYANRPFAYLIVEKTTNIVLFCGTVKNPIKK